MHRRLLFLARGGLQDCSRPLEHPFPSSQALQRGRALCHPPPPPLPPHPARAEPLHPWGQHRGRKGEPREGRSGWTASRHKYVWLSSHLLVGLTGEIVFFPHLLLSPKQRAKLKPCHWNHHWSQQRIIVPSGWWWVNTINKDRTGQDQR